jgi:DNA-binding beta-propeller fold protein YncE
MKPTPCLRASVLVFAVALCAMQVARQASPAAQGRKAGVPVYQLDPAWPQMEGNWIFGSIGGLAIDPSNDHVFVLNRASSLADDEDYANRKPPIGACCVPAPRVMEFDASGKLIQGWGGPGPGYEWPVREHGITLDYKGNLWLGGNDPKDNHFLKFTKAGKFLLQIGHAGKTTGSGDTENLNRPAKAFVYPKTNEVFIADGYGNRRVVVFDADSGQYKRHWGAYGNKPDDKAPRDRPFTGPGSRQFDIPHGVLVANDGLVYVSDRTNNRIQVFNGDGTFVKEAYIARETATPTGTACDMAFSPDQRLLYVTDPGNHYVWMLDRETLEPIGHFGRLGHQPGQFSHLHVLAVDSKGNVYTGENDGKRVQKFLLKGRSPAATR